MQDCLNPVSTNAIRSEEDMSFEYDSFNDLLHKLDEGVVNLKTVLTKNITRKNWLKSDYEYITDYIQDIINIIDTLVNAAPVAEQKFKIQSDITGGQEKTLLQTLTIIVKELDALKKKVNNNTSSIYTPNV